MICSVPHFARWFARLTLLIVIVIMPPVSDRAIGGHDDRQPASPPDALAIFASRCLNCHNSVDRKGDFSLQSAKELFESGFVVPQDAAGSHLLNLLLPDLPNDAPKMPKDSDPLSVAEVKVIQDWIARGAEWPEGYTLREPVVDDFEWWSFRPLQRPPVPPLDNSETVGERIANPIDAFIRSRQRQLGLVPSAPAPPATLIRRLTYDLTGLPPTPDEVRHFVADSSPTAYAQLVERLLASSAYGEHWARHWLDVARYADTCGYDKDKLRPNAWPYRDYVIRSFNNDKPYSRFIREQIAGDVLYPESPDGILGLGFIAAGPWDFIGHVEVPESKIDGKVARNLDRDDMLSNTLNTFCSVTIQCARCHNHKFDPFTQQHYYSLQSVFAAVDRAERRYDTDPATEHRRQELRTQQTALKSALSAAQTQLLTDGGPVLENLEKSIATLRPQTMPKNKRDEFGYHSQIAPDAATEKWVEVDLGQDMAVQRVILNPCHDDFNNIGAGFGFPVRFQVTAVTSAQRSEAAEGVVLYDSSTKDLPNPGLAAVEVAAQTPAGEMRTVAARFIRVTATELASRQNDFILALAELQVLDAAGQNVAAGAAVTALDSIEAPIRWRKSNLTDGHFATAADPEAASRLADAVAGREKILLRIDSAERRAERERVSAELKAIEQSLASLPKGRMVYAAATQFEPQGNFRPTMGVPRTVSILHRGNETQPGEIVGPGTIPLAADDNWQFALPADHSEGLRRAELAHWIARGDNPLTWRSVVNRIWQYHFGDAIVESPNDFGKMGQLPTHPELLDWLATEFRDNGGSFKHLHRLIVTSATYRQNSEHHAANAAIDIDNRYLWRINRRRLTAEEVRDSVLAVSGKLNPEMGGPGFYLFDLEKPEHSPHFEYDKFDPEDIRSHRRSVYRFVVRSQPDPFMTTLDCADSSQSTPRRNETLTSLQALSLLNSRFTLSMARHFAARLGKDGGTIGEQVGRGFELATGREPTDKERSAMLAYTETHGLENLCRLLFNLNEFVFVE